MSNSIMREMPISFPGLFPNFEINISPVALNIGHGVYWYGIIIALGFLLAVMFCARRAPRYGIKADHIYDMLLFATPAAIVGARAYYVIFYPSLYVTKSGAPIWKDIVAIWDGGLAIYGGIIGAIIVVCIFCKVKKLSIGAMLDLGCMGLLIGQAVGRWGNFMNREAFGTETTLPWRMRLWETADSYIEVHPTFLYESLWNLVGLILIVVLVEKIRKFDGENFCFYLLWYGLGRLWIEGLRTDSLYFFGLELFGYPIRVSQILSAILIAAAVVGLVYKLVIKKANANDLFVNRI